jgi:16S rRNA (uracil1498-N3)-methyltransferase
MVAVGPEGGFSEEEVRHAEMRKFLPVSLGNRILRAETAAIAAIAIVQFLFGDVG